MLLFLRYFFFANSFKSGKKIVKSSYDPQLRTALLTCVFPLVHLFVCICCDSQEQLPFYGTQFKTALYVFVVVVVSAYAIRCRQCRPDMGNFTTALSTGNISAVNLCNNPTGSFDCSQDPNIGQFADSCYTATVTLNVSLFNIGEITYHVLDCAMKSVCPQLKKTVCDPLKTALAGISGVGISHCDTSCCVGDLCNNPSGSPTTSPSRSPTTSPPGSPTTSPSESSTAGFPTSSVKSTHIPPNVVVFGILGLFTVALSLF